MENDPAIQAARQDFDRDGFAVVRAFLSPDALRELLDQIDRYVREVVPKLDGAEVYYEEMGKRDTIMRLERMDQYDPYFDGFLRGRWMTLAELMLGEPVVPQRIAYFDKPPLVGKETPPHQDGFYTRLEPNEGINFWLALDPVDEQNGCLRYVRGSHRRGLRTHKGTEVLGFSQAVNDFGEEDLKNEAVITAEPGDLIFHHLVTIHRAGANRSDRSRRALGGQYWSHRARYDAEGHAEYQRRLHEKLAARGRI